MTRWEIPTPLEISDIQMSDGAIVRLRRRVTRTHFNLWLRGAPAHPELVEGRGNLDRLHTRRRTAVATATGLPRCARNDKVAAHEENPETCAAMTVEFLESQGLA